MSLCGGPDVLVMDNWVHKYGLVSMEGRGREVFLIRFVKEFLRYWSYMTGWYDKSDVYLSSRVSPLAVYAGIRPREINFNIITQV